MINKFMRGVFQAVVIREGSSLQAATYGGLDYGLAHGGRCFVFYADDDEKPAFPFYQDRRARFALPGNNRVSFPMSGLHPPINRSGALGYINTVRYRGPPEFLARRPFMPLFMAADQVFDEVPPFRINPPRIFIRCLGFRGTNSCFFHGVNAPPG
jgi:hypothetical protein